MKEYCDFIPIFLNKMPKIGGEKIFDLLDIHRDSNDTFSNFYRYKGKVFIIQSTRVDLVLEHYMDEDMYYKMQKVLLEHL